MRPRVLSAKAATYSAMWAFFLPLAASQILQQARHPLLDAGIARGIEPEASLAAFGIVSGIVQILGAAGIAVQSAYLVLVRGRRSYEFMRRYTWFYMVGILVLTLTIALPGVGEWFFERVMGTSPSLTPRVSEMMQIGVLIPVCNLARLFFVAKLAHLRQTRVVWMGPAVSIMLLAVLALAVIPNVPVAASTAGTVVWLAIALIEAVVLGWLAQRAAQRAPYDDDPATDHPLEARYVTWFILPLIATQFSLAAGLPLTNAGLLRLAEPEESVAALRVSMSIIMVTMAALATLRQVVLVMGQEPRDHHRVRKFVIGVSLVLTGCLALIAFTPLNAMVLEGVIGAPPVIAAGAIPALQIFVAIPLVMGVRQFYSGLTMHQHRTSLVALPAGARLVLMAALLFVLAPAAGLFGAWVGAMARTASMASESAAAYVIGRRYVGLEAIPGRQPPKPMSDGPVLPKRSD